MAVRDFFQALGGGGSLALVVDAVVGSGQLALVLVDFFVGNIDMFLTLFATLSGRLAPEVAWLPEDVLNKVVLALAAIYVVVIAWQIIGEWNDER